MSEASSLGTRPNIHPVSGAPSSGARSDAPSGALVVAKEKESRPVDGGERERPPPWLHSGILGAAYPAAVRRWKKVGRLRERRRRPKASRIAPGAIPKYRTELARPHCRIRLPACQIVDNTQSHWERRILSAGCQPRRRARSTAGEFRFRAAQPRGDDLSSPAQRALGTLGDLENDVSAAAFPRSLRSARTQTHTRSLARCRRVTRPRPRK